jgi:hypothetical protein
MTTMTRLPYRMPAKEMPEAKLPDEWAATGNAPTASAWWSIQLSAPINLKDPTGVHP